MGAGIDHILADNNFPEHLAVARLVDPYLVDDMFDYLTAQVSGFRHHHQLYFQCQLQQQWQPLTPLSRNALVIGVMGLGQIGGQVAKRFAEAGYRVVGWSNSAKSINGVKSFTGPGALENFLAETNLLINLLPLTKETQGILSAKNLIKLKPGAFLINVGRGGHLVEADLVALLDNRHLSGACLDVFEQEPLPLNHPFWSHPNIMITPHVSSLTNPESVAPQILKNYRRSEKGETLINQVDLKRGY